MLLVVEINGVLRDVTAFGPVFSSHVWSTIWVAMACPRERLSLGVKR